MSKVGTPRHDAVPIGEIAEPPFARLPDPSTLFQARAERFQELSAQHELAPFLRFLAGLSFCQHQLQDGLPDADPPSDADRERAREHAMPPLDRSRFTADAAFDATLGRLLQLAPASRCRIPRASALARLTEADAAMRTAMARAVLANEIPVEAFAEHVFVAAALQVHYARLASGLVAKRLVPVGDGACPVCGGAPVSFDGGGLAGRSQFAILCLLVVRDAVALRADQMHIVQLHQGHLLSRGRGRRRHDLGRNLRSPAAAM